MFSRLVSPLSPGEAAQRQLHVLVWTLFSCSFAYGLYRALDLWWVGDDAFISFRYAKNLVDGHGLVFNVGERVEGYSNFLWTVLIAFGILLKADPIPFSLTLSIIAYAATAIVLVRYSWQHRRDAVSGLTLFMPLSAICLMIHHEHQVFATSGLETAAVTFLLMWGFTLLVSSVRPLQFFRAGLVLTLAALTRPDFPLFVAMSLPYILLCRGSRLRNLASFVLPFVTIYVPYWLLRYNYYGYPFPNTYYAKSADLPYYSQGIVYLWLYLKSYWVLLSTPVAVLLLARRAGWKFTPLNTNDMPSRALVLGVLYLIPYVWYVVRSGGDFMFARFLMPVTPIAFLLIESSLKVFARRVGIPWLLSAIVIAGLLLGVNLYRDDPLLKISGIANEPAYYPSSWVEQAKTTGAKLKQCFEGTDVKISFNGRFAMFAYYSEVPVAIESSTGLTDEYLAHLPLTARGRPGHEKRAPLEYLIARKVNFMMSQFPTPTNAMDSILAIYFDSIQFSIVTYNNDLMDRVDHCQGVRFIKFPDFLDSYLPGIESMSRKDVRDSYQFARAFYFEQNADPRREQLFLDRLRRQ